MQQNGWNQHIWPQPSTFMGNEAFSYLFAPGQMQVSSMEYFGSTSTSPSTPIQRASRQVQLPVEDEQESSQLGSENCQDQRPQCRICWQRFARLGNLNNHMATHEAYGSRKHACAAPGCARRFLRQSDLCRHRLAKHELHCPFGCENCPKKFTRKDSMKRHMFHNCQNNPRVTKAKGKNATYEEKGGLDEDDFQR